MKSFWLFLWIVLLSVCARGMDLEWKWDTDPLAQSYANTLSRIGLKVEQRHQGPRTTDIEFTIRDRDSIIVYKWMGHGASSFVEANGTLFVCHYNIYEPGIKITAVDIAARRVVWERRLPQEAQIRSKCVNLVNIEFRHGLLVIYSKQLFPKRFLIWMLNPVNGDLVEQK